MAEIWKDIPGYDGKYQVSNLGNVKAKNYKGRGYEKVLAKCPNERGYLMVCLRRNGKGISEKVHRLVAKVFVPNSNGYKEINHIDSNKENNCASNLEWCTRKENMEHAEKNGLMEMAHRNSAKACIIPVLATNKKTGEEHVFGSMSEAAKCLGVSCSKISDCLKGKRRQTGGYYFRKAVE